jgi:hypothetical protein
MTADALLSPQTSQPGAALAPPADRQPTHENCETQEARLDAYSERQLDEMEKYQNRKV